MSDSRDRAGDAVLVALAAVRQVRPPVELADRIREAARATPQDRRLMGAPTFRLVAVAAVSTLVVGSIALGGAWRAPDGEASNLPTMSPNAPSAASLPSATSAADPAGELGTVARANAEFSIGEGLAVEPGQLVLILPGLVDHDGQPSYRIQHYGDLNTGFRPDGNAGWLTLVQTRRFLDERPPRCPEGQPDLANVAQLQPFERAICFGSRDLTIGPVTASTYSVGARLSKRWISSDGKPDFFTGLPYLLTNDMGDLVDGAWVEVTGHFNDPSAAGCGDPVAIAFCREQFHITRAVPAEIPATELRGTWSTTAIAPIDGRTDHVLVWTGSEAVVWGGWASSREQSVFDAAAPRGGAAYDPARDRWRIVPDAPIPGRGLPVAAWTGTEVLVFGGWAGEKSPLDGAAWNPATNTWRTIARSPLTGSGTVGAWLEDRLIVVTSTAAAAYDPTRDRWTSLPAAPIRPGWRTAVAASGRLFIVAFGDGATPPVEWAVLDPGTDAWTSGEAPIDPLQAGVVFAGAGERIVVTDSGVMFDPVTMTWATGGLCEGASSGTVWTGSVLLGIVAAWDTRTEQCLRLPPAPKRDPPFQETNGREFAVGVWTGTQYVTWSGGTGGDTVWVPKDGAVFTPENDLGPCCG